MLALQLEMSLLVFRNHGVWKTVIAITLKRNENSKAMKK